MAVEDPAPAVQAQDQQGRERERLLSSAVLLALLAVQVDLPGQRVQAQLHGFFQQPPGVRERPRLDPCRGGQPEVAQESLRLYAQAAGVDLDDVRFAAAPRLAVRAFATSVSVPAPAGWVDRGSAARTRLSLSRLGLYFFRALAWALSIFHLGSLSKKRRAPGVRVE